QPNWWPRSTRWPPPRPALTRRAARSARSRQISGSGDAGPWALRANRSWCWRGEPKGEAAGAPCSGRGAEQAGDGRVTGDTPAVGGELVGAEAVPVALDHQLAAAVAVGALACGVVGVAGVGVADAVVKGDAPGPGQRGRWRGRAVAHLEVGVEGGEVHRH